MAMSIRAFLALAATYLATLFYVAAMCTPWWFTKYYVPNHPTDNGLNTDDVTTFFNKNLGLSHSSVLFKRTNCFIDGSCLTGHFIYKNNGNAQWIYTTTLVLMLVGWIPWLIFLHLVHFRASEKRTPMPGRRTLMLITALLTMAFLMTAIIVFACGMVKSNGIFNTHGLYGHHASDGYFGTLPEGEFGNNGTNGRSGNKDGKFGILTNGLPLECYAFSNTTNGDHNGNFNSGNNGNGFFWFDTCRDINGTIGYKWGAHAGWYFAQSAFTVVFLALLFGLIIPTKGTVVQTQRVVERRVTTQPAVVPAQYVPAQGIVGNQTV
jgi:hypothetical protein